MRELNGKRRLRQNNPFCLNARCIVVILFFVNSGRKAVSQSISTPHRVTIKGADVNGIELRLNLLSSLSGRFVHAADSADCQIQNRRRLTDVSLILQRNGSAEPESSQGRLDQQGEFATRGLVAGSYRLGAWLPHMEWYLRAITARIHLNSNRSPRCLNPIFFQQPSSVSA
jgi:hypothetical protein